ncbi:MAG: radical SAM protein [FCB group bacterium]|nr:radical SAM protein [FCB group bacterium]
MFVYGPVPSRRLGRSLGVSPIPPKTCSYTCAYCQLGRTTDLRTQRASFYPREDILTEILSAGSTGGIDYVTFVGDGEPTLNKDLGWLIQNTRDNLHLPTAVITNGSLMSLPDVRNDLKNADVVIPSLDAGNAEIFKRIDRPHRHLDYDTILQGQIDFRQEYSGQIWIEIMLVKDLNDSEKELQSLRQAVAMIKPDRVYILTPIRPPAERWVKPVDVQTVLKAQEIIGGAVAADAPEEGRFDTGAFAKARQAILEIGSRHPLRKEQASAIERDFSETGVIELMLATEEMITVDYNGREYLLPGHFLRGKTQKRIKSR